MTEVLDNISFIYHIRNTNLLQSVGNLSVYNLDVSYFQICAKVSENDCGQTESVYRHVVPSMR